MYSLGGSKHAAGVGYLRPQWTDQQGARRMSGFDNNIWFLWCKYCDEWLSFRSEQAVRDHEEQCAKIIDGESRDKAQQLPAATEGGSRAAEAE